MQDNLQSQPVLRTWRLRSKARLRDRLLDIFGHLLVMAILILFLSTVQTVMAAQNACPLTPQTGQFYSHTQDASHVSPER